MRALKWFVLLVVVAGSWASVENANAQAISGPGAIKATKNGNFYVFDSSPGAGQNGPIAGSYTAGQEFCAIYANTPSDPGPYGNLYLTVRINGKLFDANNQSGNFVPAYDNPACSPPRDGFSSTAGLYARRAAVVGTLGVILVALVVGVVALWFASKRVWRGTLKPLTDEQWALVQSRFPGFNIRRDDFGIRFGNLTRINSNGRTANLKRWYFKPQTGEFYWISGHEAGDVIYQDYNYHTRFVMRHRARKQQQAGAIFLLIAVALGVVGYLTTDGFSVANGWSFAAFLCLVAGGLAFYNLVKQSTDNVLLWDFEVGPEPFHMAADDFGPETATAPANHPAADDLSY